MKPINVQTDFSIFFIKHIAIAGPPSSGTSVFEKEMLLASAILGEMESKRLEYILRTHIYVIKVSGFLVIPLIPLYTFLQFLSRPSTYVQQVHYDTAPAVWRTEP